MKKYLLNKIRKLIKEQYPNYNNNKLDEIMYGVEGIYLTISKTIIIFIIAFLLNIEKELFFLLLSFNLIRTFAFGMHADKSSICLIFSSLLFLGASFLCKYIILSKEAIYILYIIAIALIAIFSPSDTVKRPLINKKKRLKWKILSIIVSFIYFITSIYIKDNIIINYLIFGLLIECILINPLTYKAFNMPYNNFKNYGLNTK